METPFEKNEAAVLSVFYRLFHIWDHQQSNVPPKQGELGSDVHVLRSVQPKEEYGIHWYPTGKTLYPLEEHILSLVKRWLLYCFFYLLPDNL